MPLLAQRILLLTLSRVSDEQISVNIIPKPLKSGQQDGDAALTTPLGITGTPKELDEQLPRQLVEFAETHLGLSSTLKSAKEQMEAAAKAAREASRKATNPKSQSSRNATPSTGKAQTECVAKESSEDAASTAEHPSLRQLLPGAPLARVPEACSTLKQRAASEASCAFLLTDQFGKESSWKYIAWNENLDEYSLDTKIWGKDNPQ